MATEQLPDMAKETEDFDGVRESHDSQHQALMDEEESFVSALETEKGALQDLKERTLQEVKDTAEQQNRRSKLGH